MSNLNGRGGNSISPSRSNNFVRGRGYGRGDRDFRGGPNPRFMRGRGGPGYGGPRFGPGGGGDGMAQRESFTPRGGGFRGRGNSGPNGQPPPGGMFNQNMRPREMNFSRGRGGPPFSDFPSRGFPNFSRPPRGTRMGDARRGSYGHGGQPVTPDVEVHNMNDQRQYNSPMSNDPHEEGNFVPSQPNMWSSNHSHQIVPQNIPVREENDTPGPSSHGGYRSSNEMTQNRNYQRPPPFSSSGPPSKMPRTDQPKNSESENFDVHQGFDVNSVTLNWYDSDLHLEIDTYDFCSAKAVSTEGFGYLWAGVKATHGSTRGKVCYEVYVDGNADTSHLESEPNPNVLRVGWSTSDTQLQLGEEQFSYGFGGTAKSSTRGRFNDYGNCFGVGDVVGCYLDAASDPIKISYTVNGYNCGIAFTVRQSELQGKALFPHIFTKNQHFKVNFGQWPEPMQSILPGFRFIGLLSQDDGIVRGPVAPATKEDCEVVMMVGLPGSGKSTWVSNWMKANPDKKYNILGTNAYIDKMKVTNLSRWRNYHGRWDQLIPSCTKCFEHTLAVAFSRRRNYIIDQTNVYPSARERKLREFAGFNCKAVVVIPNHEEYLRRCRSRAEAEGIDVPEDAVLAMKANFALPDFSERFSDVVYTEMPPSEALLLVQQYNIEASMRGIKPNAATKRSIPFQRQETNTGSFVPIGRIFEMPQPQASTSGTTNHTPGTTLGEHLPADHDSSPIPGFSPRPGAPPNNRNFDDHVNGGRRFSSQGQNDGPPPFDNARFNTSRPFDEPSQNPQFLEGPSFNQSQRFSGPNFNQNARFNTPGTRFRGPPPGQSFRGPRPNRDQPFSGLRPQHNSRMVGPPIATAPPFEDALNPRLMDPSTEPNLMSDNNSRYGARNEPQPIRPPRQSRFSSPTERPMSQPRDRPSSAGRQTIHNEHSQYRDSDDHSYRGGHQTSRGGRQGGPFTSHPPPPPPSGHDSRQFGADAWSRDEPAGNARQSWSAERTDSRVRDKYDYGGTSSGHLNPGQSSYSKNESSHTLDTSSNWRHQRPEPRPRHPSGRDSATKRSYDAGPGGPQDSWSSAVQPPPVHQPNFPPMTGSSSLVRPPRHSYHGGGSRNMY